MLFNLRSKLSIPMPNIWPLEFWPCGHACGAEMPGNLDSAKFTHMRATAPVGIFEKASSKKSLQPRILRHSITSDLEHLSNAALTSQLRITSLRPV